MNLSENKVIEFYKDGYYILIKETPECYEAYLQDESKGIIEIMYGWTKDEIDFWEFTKLVEEDLEGYKEYYMEEYGND